MNRRQRLKAERQKRLAAQHGPIPSEADSGRALIALLSAEPTAATCDYAPGTWRPAPAGPSHALAKEPREAEAEDALPEIELNSADEIEASGEGMNQDVIDAWIERATLAEAAEARLDALVEQTWTAEPTPPSVPTATEEFAEFLSVDRNVAPASVTEPSLRALCEDDSINAIVNALRDNDVIGALDAEMTRRDAVNRAATEMQMRGGSVDEAETARALKRADEDRVRERALALNEESLDEVRRTRETLESGTRARGAYNAACQSWKALTEEILSSPLVRDRTLIILEAQLRATREAPDAGEVAEFGRLLDQVSGWLDGQDRSFDLIRAEQARILELQRGARDARAAMAATLERLEQLPELCKLFRLPYPKEIRDLVDLAVERTNRSYNRPVHDGVIGITLNDPEMPNELLSLKTAMPKRLALLSECRRSVERPARNKDDIAYAVLLFFGAMVTDRRRGIGLKTVVKTLIRSGLVLESERELLRDAANGMANMFKIVELRKGDMWVPHPHTLSAARSALTSHPERERLPARILDAYEAVREEAAQRVAERKRAVGEKSATSSDETDDS